MAILKSFEAVLYTDKVKNKSTFLRPLPPFKYNLENTNKKMK